MEQFNTQQIFSISSEAEFENLALKVFEFQYQKNAVYHSYCKLLNRNPNNVKEVFQIPFLPIQFFKSHSIISTQKDPDIIFESSGTTQSTTSKHLVPDVKIYEESFLKGFEQFYGPVEDYCILALLPAYLERQGSSLVYMVDDLVKRSKHPSSGFYLNNLHELHEKLMELEQKGTKTLLIGVSFALLDLAEQFPMKLKHTTIMETGGMKGRRKELIRAELHQILTQAFGVATIHSEYGMTELLSQAYSKGNGIFETPPWMKLVTRDTEDPLTLLDNGKTGGINIIDLANVYSCSFIATQDLGKIHTNKSFEIMGRFDNSDIRGCNLMVL
ncbi:acyl transferase [Flagellimonas zhangzhouensis]|uniref:Acyl-protein synthetase, LuxE n=1 Tax=Flagellimonas zhangzhouensis TaxID=1073328 RepID=A0A1H2VFX5_9FLAO|nr:acyl transferase [Allomuricauda zhangzhouensis]SDQ08096.1 Acyl-protein synthetase, LuxE [Allomuricauda zhangzhouensis]SDW67243.1 Acyl-protein synthetase, LuxE [Allomuricauda zhangzhouensis]